MAPRRLILDTDIGTNVDDALALALALASPEIELAAVTTVHGDVTLRARIALKLLRLAGRGNVCVARGADLPISDAPSVYWEGHEGHGLLDGDDLAVQPASAHAVDVIIHEALDHPGDTWLAAIGPLTNLALALVKESALPKALAGITIMGGVAREAVEGAQLASLPPVDRNFRSDPYAAQIVLAAGIPVHLVPLALTTQVRIDAAGVAAITATGDPFHLALAQQIETYPAYRERGWTCMHDPLAVATIVAPELVTWEPVRGRIDTGGEPAGALHLEPPSSSSTIHLATEVNAGHAQGWIMERLTRRAF